MSFQEVTHKNAEYHHKTDSIDAAKTWVKLDYIVYNSIIIQNTKLVSNKSRIIHQYTAAQGQPESSTDLYRGVRVTRRELRNTSSYIRLTTVPPVISD